MKDTSPDLKSSKRGGMRLAARIATRDALQHKGRSVLIVALVALPIIALSGFATVATSNVATPAEQARIELGSNQAELTVVGGPNPKLVQDPTEPTSLRTGPNEYVSESGTEPVSLPSAYLPAGTRILSLRSVAVVATTAGGIGGLSAIQGEPWDKAFAGRYEVLSGHRPSTDSEIMASPAALVRLGATVGSTVTISEPQAATYTIVGTLRDLTAPSSTQELFGRAGAFDGESLFAQVRATSFYLPDRAISWSEVQALNKNGVAVLSRVVLLNPPAVTDSQGTVDSQIQQIGSASVALLPLLGFTLFEVALLAGAAFMVGTKQQQRGLATLASVGGDRRMLSRVVSYAGIALGLMGGIIGSAIGVAGAAAYMSATSDGDVSRYPGFHVNPALAAGIVLFAVISGWVSALVPARAASRVDVVSALRGSVRPGKPSRKTPVIGIAVAILGAVVTVAGCVVAFVGRGADVYQRIPLAQLAATLIVVGPILLQIAALVIAPLVLRAIARLLSRVGTGARLASRDAARNASRSVPAIGAIMSTIFVASFFMTYLFAAQAQESQDWRYSAPIGTLQSSIYEFDKSGAEVAKDNTALRSSIESIVGKTGAVALSRTAIPNEESTDKDKALYPVVVADASTRCAAMADGRDPGTRTITDRNCAEPNDLVYPRVGFQLTVASPHAIELATGASLTAAARTMLASGGVVAFGPGYIESGHVTVAWLTRADIAKGTSITSAPAGRRTVSIPATTQVVVHQTDVELAMLPATARTLGLSIQPRGIVLRTGVAPTDEQRDAIQAATQAILGDPNGASTQYESGPPTSAGTWAWALLAVCAIIALGAAGVALGLARSDGRRNEAVLGSLGAPPLLRRSFGFWSGVVLTGVGAIGGVVLGTVPAIAVAQSFLAPNGGQVAPFSLPWAQLAVTALGLPLVLALASWLTAARTRIRYNDRASIG